MQKCSVLIQRPKGIKSKRGWLGICQRSIRCYSGTGRGAHRPHLGWPGVQALVGWGITALCTPGLGLEHGTGCKGSCRHHPPDSKAAASGGSCPGPLGQNRFHRSQWLRADRWETRERKPMFTNHKGYSHLYHSFWRCTSASFTVTSSMCPWSSLWATELVENNRLSNPWGLFSCQALGYCSCLASSTEVS